MPKLFSLPVAAEVPAQVQNGCGQNSALDGTAEWNGAVVAGADGIL